MEDGHGSRTTFGSEDLGELVVVVGHHASFGRPLGAGVDEKTVNILDGSESLLPQLELDGIIQLNESQVEVSREGVDVGKVDGKGLVRVLLSVLQFLSDLFTQSSELALSVVDLAKVESLQGDVLRGVSLRREGMEGYPPGRRPPTSSWTCRHPDNSCTPPNRTSSKG